MSVILFLAEGKMNRKILTLFFVILIISNVAAVGVTPGRRTFDYEAGKTENVQFSVINSENKEVNVAVFVEGELAEHVALSDVAFSMSSGDERKDLFYTLTMPPDLKPGQHETDIIIMQLSGQSGTGETFIGAAVGTASQLLINVPYPGKFVEAEMSVVDEEGKIQFVIPVVSRGNLDIARVGAEIEIFSSLNEKIGTLKTNSVSLASRERKEISVLWEPDVSPGPYRAVATIAYDEQTLKIEKEFDVGAKKLSMEGVAVNDFSLGEIAKFEIFVQNHWSESVKGAFAQMQIFNDDGKAIADFNSANYDLPPNEKTLMVAFWDSEGVKEGKYDSTLFLRYGDSSEQKNLELQVSKNEIKIIGAGFIIAPIENIAGGMSTKVLAGVIIFLVVVNLSWFVFLRKKIFGKNEK